MLVETMRKLVAKRPANVLRFVASHPTFLKELVAAFRSLHGVTGCRLPNKDSKDGHATRSVVQFLLGCALHAVASASASSAGPDGAAAACREVLAPYFEIFSELLLSAPEPVRFAASAALARALLAEAPSASATRDSAAGWNASTDGGGGRRFPHPQSRDLQGGSLHGRRHHRP